MHPRGDVRRIGDYLVERELEATDSSAAHYLASHVVLPRQVALRVMHEGPQYDRAVAVQMLKEACLLEAIVHPAVPRVYECGVLADRRPWTAFEHVDAPLLAALVARAPMAVADLVVLLRDTADALQHAHARAIVHRKLSPLAILSTPGRLGSTVFIRDWGAAQTMDGGAASGDATDDVHALGAVAYRALTGEPYARGMSAGQHCPAAPDELTTLVDRMLAPDPGDRPTAGEVRDRASWLATTVASLVLPPTTTRWTPPHGLNPGSIPAVVEDPASGFVIRISRTPTR